MNTCGDGVVGGNEVCDDGKANGTPGHCKADCSGLPAKVSVEGDVLAFFTEVRGPRVAGAKVSILEHPEMTFVTKSDAHFRFDGLEEGTDVTLVVEHADYETTQTNTVTLGAGGIDPFPIQVVSTSLFNAVAALVPLPVEEKDHCVIATTAARMGGSLYVALRQGMPGVTVALDPAPAKESGPLYFNESVVPDPKQPSTTIDGGVLFYRLEPGDYTMSAKKPKTAFGTARFRCRAGIVVNAGPPMGILANVKAPDFAAGKDLADDADTAASDALCEATAKCVNAASGHDDYPAATVASCKASFRNTWAFVDPTCDKDHALRDKARATYVCRAKSCALTLGGDTACANEDAAFRAAEATYGACVSAKH
jgi:hypothetical protein